MKTKCLLDLLFVSLFITSCSAGDSDSSSNSSTIADELNPAKAHYSQNGAVFKFRVYNFPPNEGDTNNNNNHMASVYRIIDNQGAVAVIARYTVPAISLQSTGGILNIQSEIISPQSNTAVPVQNINFDDDFEIDNNNTRLLSYNYSGGQRGGYGFTGARIYVYNPVYFSGAVSASSNQGYLHTLNDSNFMLSMGLNSNYGKPMLYQYIPSTFTWNGTVVPQMDYVQGSGINIPTTNDASKVGNTDKVYWAWLSYTSTLSNGKINILNYNGSTFSAVTSLDGIGSVGTGWSTLNTITLHKNPTNLNNPYIVVRRYNTDILDIYKFTGSAIEVIKTGVTLPASIPIVSGSTRAFKEIKFTGNGIYLITGFDKNLYKLSDHTFVIDRPDLAQNSDIISAIESTSSGLLVSVVTTILSTPQPKTVSDVVLIPN